MQTFTEWQWLLQKFLTSWLSIAPKDGSSALKIAVETAPGPTGNGAFQKTTAAIL
jgi:hypothetical protein